MWSDPTLELEQVTAMIRIFHNIIITVCRSLSSLWFSFLSVVTVSPGSLGFMTFTMVCGDWRHDDTGLSFRSQPRQSELPGCHHCFYPTLLILIKGWLLGHWPWRRVILQGFWSPGMMTGRMPGSEVSCTLGVISSRPHLWGRRHKCADTTYQTHRHKMAQVTHWHKTPST